MAINIQTATVQELRDERKRINDRIRAGGLSAGQLANAQRNLNMIKEQLSNLNAQSMPVVAPETTIGDPRYEGPGLLPPTPEEDVTGEEVGDDAVNEPPKPTPTPQSTVNPNDVNNNGIPDSVEAAQVAAKSAEQLYLEQARASKKSGIDLLKETFRQYFTLPGDDVFLNQLIGNIDEYAKQDYDAATIRVLLPQTQAYKTRFAGNEGRLAAGLTALSPADYLAAENTYSDTLRRFNLTSLASRDIFSKLIGGLVSENEFLDRIVNVYDRVQNADPALKAEMERVKELSRGQLTDADFAKALLTGDTGANELKRKIAVAEISAEARQRQLSVQRAQELQQLGVTREQARAGFETIAQAQPTFEKLAGIYDRDVLEPVTAQTELEQEVFQGMQSQRRKRLVEQEAATFAGSSGISGSALSTQRAGQI